MERVKVGVPMLGQEISEERTLHQVFKHTPNWKHTISPMKEEALTSLCYI